MARPMSPRLISSATRPATASPPSARRRLLGLLTVVVLLGGVGCSAIELSDLHMPFKKDVKVKRRENIEAALRGTNGHSKYIGDYVSIKGEGVQTLQGVGLINGLDGTGEDPPASYYRKMLLDDMRRMKIENPENLLASPNTALVIVTAYLPPLVRKGDRIDVEVSLPEGSETTSLAGGWLLPCRLSEFAYVDGGMREGKELARSSGPVILFSAQGSKGGASLKKGLIPGGAEYIGEDRNLTMGLRPDYVGARMVTKIENRISQRFHGYDKAGIKKKMAEAKTDSTIELTVHDKYLENYPRYLQVIRHMTLNETPIDRHMRMQQVREQLLVDETAERAALELEGMGAEGLSPLKDGLKAPGLEARFRSAEALAYLGNADGVKVLEEAADKEPAFRAYALAALAILPDGDAILALRNLMNHPSMETRYGAFRALSTAAPHESAIAGINFDQHFSLHVVESTGDPMIHLTRYKKSEIVLFNSRQEFLTPLVVRAGGKFLVQSSPDGTHIVVTRTVAGERQIREKVSRRIGDVIRTLADLGAGYPDLLAMLVEADRQGNLPGPIGIDALPQAGRVYLRPNASEGEEQATIGGEGLAPNIFGTGAEERPAETPKFTPLPKDDAEAKDEEQDGKKPKTDSKPKADGPADKAPARPTKVAEELPPPPEEIPRGGTPNPYESDYQERPRETAALAPSAGF